VIAVGHSYSSDPVDQVPFEFELDGVAFVATGTVTLLDLSELAKLAEEDVTSAAGAAAIATVFRAALDADYERFKAHLRTYRTRPDTIIKIMGDLIGYVSEGPTEPPTPSRAGRSATTGLSVDDLQFPGLPAREPHEFSDEEIANIRALLPGGR
jgi:hypothetical protein